MRFHACKNVWEKWCIWVETKRITPKPQSLLPSSRTAKILAHAILSVKIWFRCNKFAQPNIYPTSAFCSLSMCFHEWAQWSFFMFPDRSPPCSIASLITHTSRQQKVLYFLLNWHANRGFHNIYIYNDGLHSKIWSLKTKVLCRRRCSSVWQQSPISIPYQLYTLPFLFKTPTSLRE